MPHNPVSRRAQQEQRLLHVRNVMLDGAGWGIEKQQKLLRKALNRTAQALDAMKGDEPDWQARLRAAEHVKDLTGVDLSRQANSDGPGKVTVHLNMDWFRPAPTISSGQGPVIEITDMQPVENAEDANG